MGYGAEFQVLPPYMLSILRTIDFHMDRGSMPFRKCLTAVVFFSFSLVAQGLKADSLVEEETRSALARSVFGVTGKGVAVAIFDRGIDWSHPDFRNPDGTTRIAAIYDLTDDTGATAAANPFGAGTIYSREQINQALSARTALATRDAVGHGTATAGNCCGNGRASAGKYVGVAPESTLIIVKITSDGAPAHDSQPAESAFWQPALFPMAVDFSIAKARELGMPLVMLANIGSIGGQADGTDDMARKIDAVVGPGKPGLAFVTGTGDDGGRNNHASGRVGSGQTLTLQIRKGQSGTVRLSVWYEGTDRFDVSVASPTGNYGVYPAPPNNGYETRMAADFNYQHNGSVYYVDGKRVIYIQFTGPAGDYSVNLSGATVASGLFHAYLSPATYNLNDTNRFLSNSVPGWTIWPAATAQYNIVPTSYVFRTQWKGLDGYLHAVNGEGNIGELWKGSSAGPTWDGRIGVDVAAPGDHNITTYAPSSYWATVRGNMVEDGNGLYGMASAVSAANPLVTGVVALMLQRNPNADAEAIKLALQRSARADAFTGAVPNPNFGYGKLDALEAVRLVSTEASVPDCLFNWAERTYPQYFSPPGAVSTTYSPYYYRYYAGTRNYVALSIADEHIRVLGPSFGAQPMDVGPLSNYAGPANCSPSNALKRR